MAANIVGDAYVVVRAITAGVEKDIANAFNNVDRVGRDAGDRVGKSFQRGLGNSTKKGIFSDRFRKEAIAANTSFTSLTRKLYFIQPAIVAVSGAIGVLGTGLISLVSIIGTSAVPALLVLGQAFTAVGQAALTARLAFQGVAKAIQAGTKAQKGGTGAAKKQADLTERIRRAQVDYSRLIRDNGIAEKDARDRVTDANREYTESLREAKEELQQLAFDSEDAAISEQKAALELEKAREALARVSDLPPNSRARKEAELAFAEADLNYRRAIDANNDLKEQEAKNAKLGPDIESQAKGQQSVIDAAKELSDAKRDETNLLADNAEAQRRAAYDLEELINGQDDAAGSADAYADALDGLSKEAKAFVEYMVNTFIPSLKALREAAGKELFPKLEEALEKLRLKLFPRLIPLLEGTGSVLGDVANRIADVITASDNLDRIERIWKSNDKVIKNLGDALAELIEVFLILFDAVSPLTEEFSKFLGDKIKGYKEFLETKEGAKQLSERLAIVRDTLKDLGTVFGNTFRGLSNLFWENVGPGSGGEVFLNFFKDVSKKFEELETIDGKPIKTFFKDAAENGVEFLKLLGNITGGFLTLADNPELGTFFGQLNTVTDIFQRIGENLTGSLPAFGDFLIQFSLLIEKFTEAGSITIFFNVLSKVLEVLNSFFGSPIGQAILKLASFILPVVAAFGAVQIAVTLFAKVAFGAFFKVQNAIKNVGNFMRGLAGKDPFSGVRRSSGLTRTELQRQMIIDKQKAAAMKGVYISGNQAAAGIRNAGVASKTATPLIAAGGGAASKASIGLKAFGKAFALIGGPIGIILLLLPTIIENWDKIVAFFKELPAKIGEIFSKVWDKVTEALPKIIDKIKEWVGNVIGWLKENWPLILAVLTGPFGLLILAVVKNWDKIIEFIQGIGAKLAEVGAKIWDWIVDSFKKVVDLYIGAWSAIFDFIKGLGGKLLEIGAKIWDWVVDTFKKAVGLYIGAWEAVFNFIKGLGSKLLEIGKNIWDWIVDFLKQRIENLKTNFGLMIDFVKGLPAKALEAGKAIWGWVSEKLSGVITRAKELFNGLIDWIKGLPGRVASAAGGLFNGIRDAFRGALNWIIGKWNSLSFTLPSITAFGKTIGGATFRVPQIPTFATGGIVQPSSSGTLGLIAEAGRPERIEPLDPDGLSKRDKAMIEMLAGPGKGVTVNVYPSAGMDERELAAIVSRQLSYAMRKGAA